MYVCNRNYVTIDVTIPLVIYIIFSMISVTFQFAYYLLTMFLLNSSWVRFATKDI